MKIGHIEIKVQQYGDGRWGFDDYSQGQRHMVRLRTRQKAEKRAADVAVCLANGRGDLLRIDASELAEFRSWKAACAQSPALSQACKEFIALKNGKSSCYCQSLKDDLQLFVDFLGGTSRPIGGIKALEIQKFLDSRQVSDRRKYNLRGAVVSLFRWARRMSYLPPALDGMTEAEKVEPIPMGAGEVNILGADQMQILIDNIKEQFLPWLLIGGFAGIRSGEIVPDRKSKKSPLIWEDFDWKHKIIVVRAATTKTKRRRDVPLLPNLAAWLAPYRNAKGPVIACPELPSERETRRLGGLIGGWPNNALRDSFCSYRARILQNVHQVSYEMGNSVAMVNRCYHLRQSIQAAKEWFNIRAPLDQFGNATPAPESIKKESAFRP